MGWGRGAPSLTPGELRGHHDPMNRVTPWDLFRWLGVSGRTGLCRAIIIIALVSLSGLGASASAAAPRLSDTYQKMVESDPYDAYALRRLLEVNKAPASLNRLSSWTRP